jgi:hypothetical protein
MFRSSLVLGTALLVAGALTSAPAQAANTITCKMNFSLSGWSAFYKTASGDGTVHCSNGQTLPVHISAKGGGLTFGKSTLKDGKGEFSGVHDIKDVLGSYANAEAHAGAGKSSGAQAMTKGEVSLAISGTGEGWDLGIAFGKFTIEPR